MHGKDIKTVNEVLDAEEPDDQFRREKEDLANEKAEPFKLVKVDVMSQIIDYVCEKLLPWSKVDVAEVAMIVWP